MITRIQSKQVRLLRDVVEIAKGKKLTEYTGSAEGLVVTPYLQIEDLRPGARPKYTTDTGKITVDEKDLIIAWDGANAGTVGYGLRGAIGSTLARLRLIDHEFDPRYLGRFLQSQFAHFQATATGATIPHVNRSALEDIRVPFFPLPEQQRIADILDKADAIRQKQRETIKLGNTLLESAFSSMFGDLEQNPHRYPVATLEEVCREIYRYPTFYGFQYVTRGVPVVRIGNILESGLVDQDLKSYVFIPLETSSRYPRTTLELNDILLAVRGDGSTGSRIGLVQSQDLIGANISPNLLRIQANPDAMSPLVLFHFLTSVGGQRLIDRFISRTAKKTITATNLKAMPIPVPPMAEQKAFSRLVKKSQKAHELFAVAFSESQDLFNSLVQHAFRGEL
jgi:type I restriction enzyme S subunit